uniref:Uncharacterized protein n=1 Tax=viral metagenome TaxID=1070528 RepID=A0A6M3JAE6_9ZZZZ
MALGGSRYRYSQVGPAIQRAGDVLFEIGADISEGETKSRYSSQIAQAEFRNLKMQDEFDAWIHENRSKSPQEKEDYYVNDFFPKYKDYLLEDMDGKAKKELERQLDATKQLGINSVRKQARQQDIVNNQVNIKTWKVERSKERQFNNEIDLGRFLIQFNLTMSPALESGDIQDLQTTEQYKEKQESDYSFHIGNYIRQHPDKIDEDGTVTKNYYIDHPNEYVKKIGADKYFDQPLFGPDEIAELKKDYQAAKSNTERIAKEEAKAHAEAIEIEISNDIIKSTDTNIPSEQRLSYSQIKAKIIQAANSGTFTDAAQVRELQHFLDSQVKNAGKESDQLERGKTRNDIYDLIEAGKKEEAKKLWQDNAWIFTSSDNDEINDDIRKIGTKVTDPMLVDALAAEGRFTTDYKKTLDISEDTTPEQLANVEVLSMARREEIRRIFREKPDMTPKQKVEITQDILAPAKEKLAGDIVKGKGLWSRFFSRTEAAYTAGLKPYMKEKSPYKIGDTIRKGGKKWNVVGFDDGEPLVEEVK